jgi:MinD-like ATPase involved in chromosome partitioning or flagellar assembly
MAAAALTARLITPRMARPASAAAGPLAFDKLGGPLVAICGLTGGAGTSTLALQLASRAAQDSGAPVLLTEQDARRPGLAAITGSTTPRALAALAREVADERPPADTFTELDDGPRLIAAAQAADVHADPVAVRSLLDDARTAHGLVIVDCGTHWTKDEPVLECATHVIWTIAATATAAMRGTLALETIAPPAGRAREILAATCVRPGRGVSVRTMRRLAAARCERLVLVPYDDGVARDARHISNATAHALAAIGAVLRRDA